MTPNTRKRKSRLAEELSEYVESWELGENKDILNVMLLSLKKLGLSDILKDNFANNTSAESRGRKLTPFAIRKVIWDFYHQHTTQSTNTSRPAKLKCSERNNLQVGLDFFDTTVIISQRGKQFYENNWMMLHSTILNLITRFRLVHSFP